MKKLYMIGGPMGVGKTTVCGILKKKLQRCVFLDGDWCWNSEPFISTDETRQMVFDNICFLLGKFLRCGEYENIVFCWVMHQDGIIDGILKRLDLKDAEVKKISLVCTTEELVRRLKSDIAAGARSEDVILRALDRLPLYGGLDTLKIDVSDITAEETADIIMGL